MTTKLEIWSGEKNKPLCSKMGNKGMEIPTTWGYKFDNKV